MMTANTIYGPITASREFFEKCGILDDAKPRKRRKRRTRSSRRRSINTHSREPVLDLPEMNFDESSEGDEDFVFNANDDDGSEVLHLPEMNF
jgi:hypothetical protein